MNGANCFYKSHFWQTICLLLLYKHRNKFKKTSPNPQWRVGDADIDMKMKQNKHKSDYADKRNEKEENMTFGQETEMNTENVDILTEENESADDEEKSELEKLQEKYDDLNDSFLRVRAEFENYRKRTMKEKAEIIKSGGEKILLEIISLVDDFERALVSLQEAKDKEAMSEGIDLIYNKFLNFLHQHGVQEIESIGQPFDAERFEAVTTIPVEDKNNKGMVVDCIQKGYQLNEKIIRYPKVIVGE